MLLLQRKSPSRNSEKKKFQILFITTGKVKIKKPSIQEPVLDLRQSVSHYFSFNQLYIPSYSKTLWENETKVSPIALMLHDCIPYDINLNTSLVDVCCER